MSKALVGAAELAGAVGLGAIGFMMASDGVGAAALPWILKGMEALALTGLATEAGAIASALTANRGQGITMRQAASFRQVVYGTQRIGGVEIYRSTTGSSKDQFNFVVVLGTHEFWGIQSLYLDGRLVFFNTSSGGNTTQNGINFGGSANGNTYTGPNGQQYNFGGKVYCEARYGEQLPGDVITGLTANDPTWAASSSGSPYVGGCTYVYLKIEYDTSLFPAEPEIRFTVLGKPVYDPRTGETAYSSNAALIVNDMITDPNVGLGDSSVNQAQLIAAANICDEQVALAAGGTESRYSCHWHFDTSTAPGDAIGTMFQSMAGRLSRIGGEWYIYPAAYYGPSASFDESHLTGPMAWSSSRSFRDLFNRVTGTYVAPNYPYNAAGNLYDSNGWYNGTIQNNFPFAFQPTNYPQFACDPLHGYPNDEYLDADTRAVAWNVNLVDNYFAAGQGPSGAGTPAALVEFNNSFYLKVGGSYSLDVPGTVLDPPEWEKVAGNPLPKEMGFPCVLSVAQAQRLAKITLLRNRQQGTGAFPMSLAAFQMQPNDTFNMSSLARGWSDKLLEVNSVQFSLHGGGNGTSPQIMLTLGVNETAATVYEWSVEEELTVYDVPASAFSMTWQPAPPTNVVAISSVATALVAPDGTVTARIQVNWDTPLDVRVTSIQMQYRLTGAATWIDGGSVDVSLNSGFVGPVIAGQQYNVRIRSQRANGATSDWVEIDGVNAGLVLSVTTQDGVGIGSLVGEAYSDGTAAIECNPFTALIGQLSLSIFPSGEVTLSGLAQQTLYYIYYVDPTTAGGDVTPIATTNKTDFLGKVGYFLIDELVTPFMGSGGGSGNRYAPSTYSDTGSRTTSNAPAAYDGDTSTVAQVSALGTEAYVAGEVISTTAFGVCTWSGFPAVTTTSAMNLYVTFAVSVALSPSGGAGRLGSGSISASIAGTSSSIVSDMGVTAQQTLSVAIPSGTDLSTISVTVTTAPGFEATATSSVPSTQSSAAVQVAEIYIAD